MRAHPGLRTRRRRGVIVPLGVPVMSFERSCGEFGIGDFDTFGIRAVFPISVDWQPRGGYEVSGFPRQFCVMNENIRCSISTCSRNCL